MATNHASKLFGSLLGEGQESPKVKKDVAFGVGSDEPWYFPSPKSESESVKRVAFRFEMERNGDKFQWVLVGFDVKFPRTHLCKVSPYEETCVPAQEQDKNLFIAEAEDRYVVKLYPVEVEGETWYFPNLPQEQALAAADVVAALSEAGASASAERDCILLKIGGIEIPIFPDESMARWSVRRQNYVSGQWRDFDCYGLSLAEAIRHVAKQI